MKTFMSAIFALFAIKILSGFSEPASNDNGAEIYHRNCAPCHGDDGTKGRWGAKNLQQSAMDSGQLLAVISDGRKIMPAWKKRLDNSQLLQVRDYVLTLRLPSKK